MKKKLSKILGSSLALVLLVSMLWTAVPVSGTVSGIAVTLAAGPAGNPVSVISKKNAYTIVFQAHVDLNASKDSITVVFPATTDASGLDGAASMVSVQNSVGSFAGTANALTALADANVTVASDKVTLTIDLEGTVLEDDIREGAYVKIVTTDGANAVQNPSTAGNNTLTVKTEAETTATTSTAYATINPTIVAVPGTVEGKNAAGTTLYLETGATAINDAIAEAGVVTITLTPGTYTENVELDVAGQTISSTGTTAETIISGTVIISTKTTFDGFTVTGGLQTTTVADSTVKNSVLKGAIGADVDIQTILTDNTYTVATGQTGVDVADAVKATITGGTFDVAGTGIGINTAGTLDVSTSTFTATGTTATGIKSADANETTTINSNTFDGFKIALDIDAGSVTTNRIKWNSILNSVTDAVDAEVAVNASFNWYGTTVAADITAKTDGTVATTPFLSGIATDVLSQKVYGVSVALLDAKTTVGVSVVSTTTAADLIALTKFAENPEEALTDAIAFYDVYVIGTTAATDDVSLRFHVGDADSELYIWSRDTEKWVVQTTGFSVFGGYIYITVDADLLGGTPFAVVQPTVVAPTLTIGAPVLQAPNVGAYDVALSPVFAWEPIADADGYYFALADNADFVAADVTLSDDLSRLVTTAYAYAGQLEYSKGYYWKVKAISGTVTGGDILESAWSTGVFRTIDEPVEPEDPIVIEEAAALPDIEIVLEQPDIVVPLPAETPITPTWIYVIIGVGGVLVIALIVLIVRTRRVA